MKLWFGYQQKDLLSGNILADDEILAWPYAFKPDLEMVSDEQHLAKASNRQVYVCGAHLKK